MTMKYLISRLAGGNFLPKFQYFRRFCSFYKSDLGQFLDNFPSDKMTVTAYRASKDYVHYAQAEITDSTKQIRILNADGYLLLLDLPSAADVDVVEANSDSNSISAKEFLARNDNVVVDDSFGDTSKFKKSNKIPKVINHKSKIDKSAVACWNVARLLERSPKSDAYVVETIPTRAMRVKDRSLLELLSNISMHTQVLRAQLVTKWRAENKETISSRFDLEPVFESNGNSVEVIFQIRKSDFVCENLDRIVKRLPVGYPSYNGSIQAQIPDSIMKPLRKRFRQQEEEEAEMKKHLLCAVILESVAFAKHLLDLRAKRAEPSLKRVST